MGYRGGECTDALCSDGSAFLVVRPLKTGGAIRQIDGVCFEYGKRNDLERALVS